MDNKFKIHLIKEDEKYLYFTMPQEMTNLIEKKHYKHIYLLDFNEGETENG